MAGPAVSQIKAAFALSALLSFPAGFLHPTAGQVTLLIAAASLVLLHLLELRRAHRSGRSLTFGHAAAPAAGLAGALWLSGAAIAPLAALTGLLSLLLLIGVTLTPEDVRQLRRSPGRGLARVAVTAAHLIDVTSRFVRDLRQVPTRATRSCRTLLEEMLRDAA